MATNKNQYYLNRSSGATNEVIMLEAMLDKDVIIHGNRAINAQLPQHLRKHTVDWDMFDPDAKEMAHKIERALDRRYGGDYFTVKTAKHKGTYKVVSKISGETVADVTVATEKVPFHVIGGIRYATLDHHVKRIKAILKDPNFKFRHNKDKETHQRIKLAKDNRGPLF